MSADVLRRAAALMRERAEVADDGPWRCVGQSPYADWFGLQSPHFALGNVFDRENAEHIASWQPAVALAVADWLDEAARSVVHGFDPDDCPTCRAALAVAHAYLGSES